MAQATFSPEGLTLYWHVRLTPAESLLILDKVRAFDVRFDCQPDVHEPI